MSKINTALLLFVLAIPCSLFAQDTKLILPNDLAAKATRESAGSSHAAMMGGASPHASSMGAGTAGAPHASMGAAAKRDDISWTAPASWKEMPPTSMRLGNFSIPATDGHKADVTVIPLKGSGGGIAANVNLWRSQVGLAEVSDEEAAKAVKSESIGSNTFTTVDLTGTEKLVDGKYPARLVAAMYPTPETTWFIKLYGDEQTVAGAKASFAEFLSSLKFK